jgi:uncharacterized membrane protein YphA (DoxX/SURF4 family)
MLRTVVGVTAVLQGAWYFLDGGKLSPIAVLAGLLAIAGGAALAIGFLTPLVGGLIGIVTMCIALAWFPPPSPNYFDTPLPAILVTAVAVAIAVLGPGALSVDARLFGRREIIIPHTSRSVKR